MGKTLLKGGTVLSVDPDIGDRATGDVLIEDDRIVAVEASIDADAEVVDCTGKIVIPGFVVILARHLNLLDIPREQVASLPTWSYGESASINRNEIIRIAIGRR